MPGIGDKAPAFKAVTTQGEINFPEQCSGSWVILFSHPADFTPACTSEFMTFATMEEQFARANCKPVGLSVDRLYSHIAWLRTIIYYPLSLGRNFDELYRVIIALQTADAFSIATPADWRPGDDVIVPTAGSCGVAKDRMEHKHDVTCRDWPFCTKKIDKQKVLGTILKN